MVTLARILIIVGATLIVLGGLIYLAVRLGFSPDRWLGHLPGDIRIERNNFTCVMALGTSILLSILLTVILNLLVRLLNK
jgi:Protein of unknown function (DUF2905)